MTELFKNSQWIVDEDGMVTADEHLNYWIDTKRLLGKTRRGDEVFYDWPLQLSEKTWIDYAAFEEAFRQALKIHAADIGEIDEALLEESFLQGWSEVRQNSR